MQTRFICPDHSMPVLLQLRDQAVAAAGQREEDKQRSPLSTTSRCSNKDPVSAADDKCKGEYHREQYTFHVATVLGPPKRSKGYLIYINNTTVQGPTINYR